MHRKRAVLVDINRYIIRLWCVCFSLEFCWRLTVLDACKRLADFMSIH